LPRAGHGQLAGKADGAPQIRQPEQQRARQVGWSGQMIEVGKHTAHQQRQRVADRLLPCALAVGIHQRQHLEAGPRVIVPVHPGNGKKMRQLPEGQDGEQGPAFTAHFAARGRPAHQGRERAGNGPDGRVQPRHPFQWRINKQITDKRHRADDTGEVVHKERQIHQAGHGANAAEDHHGGRLQATRGQGTRHGAAHPGVVFAFEQLVQGRRTGGDEARARSECKAWAEEMKRKVGFVDDPNQTPFLESTRLLRESLREGGDEPTSAKEENEAYEFVNKDPKDQGNRKVKYRDFGGNKEDVQQDWIYMQKELQTAMASPEKAAALRRRLRKGMEWDKANKTWKLKEEQ